MNGIRKLIIGSVLFAHVSYCGHAQSELSRYTVILEDYTYTTFTNGYAHNSLRRDSTGTFRLTMGDRAATGSGFIVNDDGKFILFTCVHDAKWMSAYSLIRLGVNGGTWQSISIYLGAIPDTNFFPPITALVRWTFSPSSDVAAIHIRPADDVAKALLLDHSIPVSALAADDQVPPHDQPLALFGRAFGMDFADSESGLFDLMPLHVNRMSGMRIGTFANQTLGKFFLVDRPVYEGFSGSPLLLVGGGGKIKCYGLGEGSHKNLDHGGLEVGIVIPASEIRKLLSAFELVGR